MTRGCPLRSFPFKSGHAHTLRVYNRLDRGIGTAPQLSLTPAP
eukprot:COSAG06_NODE_32368_length_507_cov_1.022059_2_plen_42_part_01